MDDPRCDSDEYWRELIASRRCALLAVGTSDSGPARRIESAARRAARSASIPIVAIEDFPGNYFHVDGGEASLVLVESSLVREHHLKRFGTATPHIEVLSPARYDALRARLRDLRRDTGAAWRQQRGGQCRPQVLWAGQPETEDCLRTLEAVLPGFKALDAELIFKAHPRDPAYTGGTYRRVLDEAAIPYQDATPETVAQALARAPRLVLTQFSSVAIEAGFHGIPGMCILLPDAGGARLYEKKAYSVPPFCGAGALAVATGAADLERTLRAALLDKGFRDRTLSEFDRYFAVHERTTPATVERLRRLTEPSGR